MESLYRDEVRGIDRCAIETIGVAGAVLMENAGRNAADIIERCMLDGSAAGRRVAIVAGGANNGGDGFVIARHLAMRGAKVTTFLVVDPQKISGDAAANLHIIQNLKHEMCELAGRIETLSERLGEFEVVVDAVGGTGIRGPLRGSLAAAVEQINATGRPVAAVDIPTGLDCDSGDAEGPAVKANITITFVARKKGFDSPAAAEYTGAVHVVDIGIPAQLVKQISVEQGR